MSIEGENDNDPTKLSNDNSRDVPDEGASWTTVERNATHYKMDHRKQGCALIFNHQTFQNSKDSPERNATDVDEQRLKHCLRNLNFDVCQFRNLRKEDIRHHISIVANFDFSHCNCLFIAVLSHGDNDLLQAYDGFYDPNEMFFDRFTADNCPTLAGKPKLFLLQSCQGIKTDPGIHLIHRPYRTETDGHSTASDKLYRIPVYSDFLIMYATSRGHYAFRNNTNGSYFLKVFCNEVQNLAYSEDFLNILIKINRRVALEFVSNAKQNPEYNNKKQIPYFKCSFTRQLQFVDILKQRESTEWASLARTKFSTKGNDLNRRQ